MSEHQEGAADWEDEDFPEEEFMSAEEADADDTVDNLELPHQEEYEATAADNEQDQEDEQPRE